jgi:GTP-binding protein HflX
MIEIKNPPPPEKVVIVGLLRADDDVELFEEDIAEMRELCITAGAEVVESIIQRRRATDVTTYIGSGKLKEIHGIMKRHGCTTIVIDAELSPAQVRNIEKIIQGKVIDRSQLILDIFASHARTNESRIQVELAQLRVLYPRLTHAWTHFSQQYGGIGTRGPGEKQLEVDRRLIQKKISLLKQRLKKIESQRKTQRKYRESHIPKVVLVGYTNVGKSSLLNALSGSSVHVENKLFATLDTATRRTYIDGTGAIVLSDTVGFLRKLPHHLVASFRSTLEVVTTAELLLIIMDASSAWIAQQLRTVHDVLDELGVHESAALLVFNKMDLVTDPFMRKKLTISYPNAQFCSIFDRESIAALRTRIAEALQAVEQEQKVSSIIEEKTREFTDPMRYR